MKKKQNVGVWPKKAKMNPKAPRRVVIILDTDVVKKIKATAFDRGLSMTRYLSELIQHQMKE